MTVVEQVLLEHAIEEGKRGFRDETITLTWDERRQGHGKRKSDSGTEFAISLPAGTVLKQGDCLLLDAEKVIVKVREALEPVYVMRPKTPQDWAYFAYHVGNRHQAVMIGAEELIFLKNPAVRSLLDQLRAAYTSDERAFTAALVNVGHQV
jgi:urease accessory protein